MKICNYSESAADRLKNRISENELGTEEMHEAEYKIRGIKSTLDEHSSIAWSVADQGKKCASYCAKCLNELDEIRDTIKRKKRIHLPPPLSQAKSKTRTGTLSQGRRLFRSISM